MKQRILMTVIGAFLAILLVLLMIFFIVSEGEVAIVTTLGKVDRPVTDAGLYPRWPWPIQRVHTYDARFHLLSGTLEQSLTLDQKNIVAAVYAGWRIKEPVVFFERLGTVEKAEDSLNGLVRNYKTAALARYPFSALVNVDPAALQFETIENEILEQVSKEALERYGIEVGLIGIRKLALPTDTKEKVFERMRSERSEIAERYRAEGEGEAIKIKASAESQSDKILAEAEAQATRIRGEGDAAAAEFYKTFEQDPELANFLKKLEVMEDTLKEKSTVILSSDTEPYDLFQGTGDLTGGEEQP